MCCCSAYINLYTRAIVFAAVRYCWNFHRVCVCIGNIVRYNFMYTLDYFNECVYIARAMLRINRTRKSPLLCCCILAVAERYFNGKPVRPLIATTLPPPTSLSPFRHLKWENEKKAGRKSGESGNKKRSERTTERKIPNRVTIIHNSHHCRCRHIVRIQFHCCCWDARCFLCLKWCYLAQVEHHLAQRCTQWAMRHSQASQRSSGGIWIVKCIHWGICKRIE